VKPQKRQPKDAKDGGRFVLESHPESSLVLANDDEKGANDERKKSERLTKTLDAMRKSLDKASEIASLGRDRFDEDWIVQDAAIMVLTQIGEEVKRLPKTFTSARLNIEWSKIAGMRDKLTHDYDDIDHELVWDALVHDISTLCEALASPAD